MSNIHKDTFHNICSFLIPIELTRTRVLNKEFNRWSDEYIINNYKRKNIEELACPKCGDFINNVDLEHYDGFFTNFFDIEIERQERFDAIQELFNNDDYIRKCLLCEKCEDEDEENTNVNFKYKGDRHYFLSVVDNWAVIFLKKDEKYHWNEYRICIPYLYNNYYENIPDVYIDDEDYLGYINREDS